MNEMLRKQIFFFQSRITIQFQSFLNLLVRRGVMFGELQFSRIKNILNIHTKYLKPFQTVQKNFRWSDRVIYVLAAEKDKSKLLFF